MAPEGGRGRRARRLFAAGCALGLLLTPGFNLFETPAHETVEQLLTAGRLSFDQLPRSTSPYLRGADGRYYTIHELGTVVLSLPAGMAALAVSRAAGVPFKRPFEFASAVGAAALFGLLLVALMWDLLDDGAREARARAASLLALVLSSQYAVYLGFAVDVSVAAALVVFTCVAWRASGGPGLRVRACLVVGLLGGLLVMVKISTALVLLGAGGLLLAERWRPWPERWRRLAALSLGAAPFLAAAAWWHTVHTGVPWRSPFPDCHDWEPSLVASGLAGSLVSPVKGLVIFTPALLLLPAALRTLLREPSPDRREALLVGGTFVLTLLRLAPTECWHSAAGWGIRYYVPWIPALMLVLARGVWWRPAPGSLARAGRALLVSAGLVMNLAGLVANFHYRRQICGEHPWNPRGSAPCSVAALPANLARAAGFSLPDVVVARASPAYVFVSNRLTVWWYAVRTVGVPAWASWALGLALLATAVGSWRSAFARGPLEARVRLPGTPAAISEGDA
jgi:hypothetical protein